MDVPLFLVFVILLYRTAIIRVCCSLSLASCGFRFRLLLLFLLLLYAGEAIWDKPDVVAGREEHARALEKRYSGMPQPLLLHIMSFLRALPDRNSAAGVCPTWSECARHKSFKLKVRGATFYCGVAPRLLYSTLEAVAVQISSISVVDNCFSPFFLWLLLFDERAFQGYHDSSPNTVRHKLLLLYTEGNFYCLPPFFFLFCT